MLHFGKQRFTISLVKRGDLASSASLSRSSVRILLNLKRTAEKEEDPEVDAEHLAEGRRDLNHMFDTFCRGLGCGRCEPRSSKPFREF